MTPTQKIRMGKALADDIRKRYEFTESGKPEITLYNALMQNKPTHGKGIGSLLMLSNPLFKKHSRMEILSLLVEKKCLKKESVTAYNERLWERGIHSVALKDCQEIQESTKRLKENIRGLVDILYGIEEKIQVLEEEFLADIKAMWKSGKLKHALLTQPSEKKRKTTLARSVPLNQLYPEQRKKKLEEMKYTGKDIRGLETFTVKQFQALHFLAHKAQNQTEEEKEALEIYKELGGFEDGKFRTIAYKESEYITNAQGKDHALVSTEGRKACIDAIKAIEDVEFSILWEKKGKKKKETLQIVAHHEMFKKLTLKQPWSIIRETPEGKKIKNFHFIAIPERVFEYQEIKGGSKYDGVKVLFDVINLDPDFFSTLKYADPEIQHVSEALMRLSLLFIIEGSFGCKEFIIDEEKLLKRLGLIDESRRKGRAVKTLDMYIEKLIAHETLTNAEKRGKQRVFNLPKKKKK